MPKLVTVRKDGTAVIAIGFLAGAVLLTANDDGVESTEVAVSDPGADQDASSDNGADESGPLTASSQDELDSGASESAAAAAPAAPVLAIETEKIVIVSIN